MQEGNRYRPDLKRSHRYHRLAGYVPLGYGLTCMAVNVGVPGLDAEFGFVAGLTVAVVGLVHLWQADRVGRARLRRPPPRAEPTTTGR